MHKITLAEFIEIVIADIDKRIVTLSENEISDIVKNFQDDPVELSHLLIEVEKKKDYYFHKQNDYDYSALKTATISIVGILGLMYVWYFLTVHYCLPKHKALTTLIKELETFGITFVKGKTASAGEFKQISNATHLTTAQYILARNIMDHILIMNSAVHNGWHEWIRVIIILPLVLFLRTAFRSICTWIWPKYRQRYEKYCILEQKIKNVLGLLPKNHEYSE